MLLFKSVTSQVHPVSQFSVFLSMFAASPLPGPVHFNLCSWQVARILEVSEEMRKNMGVNSGLELITLPYGHQLRLDIIERWVVLLCTYGPFNSTGCQSYRFQSWERPGTLWPRATSLEEVWPLKAFPRSRDQRIPGEAQVAKRKSGNR